MAGNNIKGITVEINGDTSALDKALKGVNKTSYELKQELKQVEKALKLDPKNTVLLAQKQEILARSITNTRDKLETLKTAEQQAQAAFANGTISADQYRALQREVIMTEQELRRLEQQASRSNQALANISETTGRAGASLSKTGKKLAPVSLAIGAIGAASTKMSIDFETSMAKVSTISDETEMPIESLEKAILKLSDDTGIAGTEIANNVYDAISAGQSTGDAVNYVTNSTKLAKAGFAEASQSLDLLTTIMNSYGLESSEVNKVSDVLINTQNRGKTTVAELSASMGKVIPTANALGVNLEQVATGYAIMTSKGIKAAETTTYMNSMLNEMGKSGTVANKTIEASTGKTFPELIKSGKSVGDILNLMNGYAKKNGKSLSDMFGSAEAGKAALILSGNQGKDFNAMLGSMGKSAGATDEAFKKVNDTTGVKLEKSFNSLKNSGIAMGDVLAPVISKVALIVQGLVEKFNLLSPSQQKNIVIIGLIVAAIPPLLMVLGALLTGVGVITGAIGLMSGATIVATPAMTALASVFTFITGPIFLTIAAIVAVIAILVLAYKHIEGFRNIVDKSWAFIQAKTKEVFEGYIMPFIRDQLMPLFTKVFNTIGDVVKGTFTLMGCAWDFILKPIFAVILFYINNILLPVWKLAFSVVGGVVKAVFGTIGSLWNNSLKPIFNGILDFISGVFTGNWRKAWSGVVSVFKGVWNGMKAIAKAPINFIIGGLNGFISGINKIQIPDWVPGVGGRGINIPRIPSFSVGTRFLPQDMLIQAHAGEMIIPKSENPYANSNGKILPGASGLTVKIENFINNREQDVAAFAQELEFYRKQQELGGARG